MNLKMKSHPAGILSKEFKHFTSTGSIIIEGSVQNSHILDTMRTDVFKSALHLFDTLISYRFFASAYAERTCVEAASGGLQLDKRLIPIEEDALFRIFQ